MEKDLKRGKSAELDKENLLARVREASANVQAAEAALKAARAQLEKNRIEAEGPDVEFARRAARRAQDLAAQKLMPQSELDKEYVVRVAGRIDEPTLSRLRHGLELDGRRLRPAKVSVIQGQVLRFVLTEGRNRQIRRMCELVGLRVMDLLRIRIGPLELGDLPEGRWRLLTAAERAAMIAASVSKPSGSASGRG
jgi:multidrug efflux pump subunit AcrA (membrane-fusion protein)